MPNSGMDLTGWTALTAVGTFVLAGVTAAALIVTAWLAVTDRRRDDRKRQEDADEWQRRLAAEREERDDYEARQVTVELKRDRAQTRAEAETNAYLNRPPVYRIFVRRPPGYPIRQLAAQIADRTDDGISLIDPDPFRPDVIADGQAVSECRADAAAKVRQPNPIIRFTDRHGNLYYAYRGQTMRFPQDTDFPEAARELDLWIHTGLPPSEPERTP